MSEESKPEDMPFGLFNQSIESQEMEGGATALENGMITKMRMRKLLADAETVG